MISIMTASFFEVVRSFSVARRSSIGTQKSFKQRAFARPFFTETKNGIASSSFPMTGYVGSWNVGHLDPQRSGCCTAVPYLLGDVLELPLTTTQDYSLFHIMRDYSTKHWQRQMNLIMGRHGLISFNIHPDYVIAPREREVYRALCNSFQI